MKKYKICLFLIFGIASSCSINKKVEQIIEQNHSKVSAKIITFEDGFSIILQNNSDDTLTIGTSLAAHGFHTITTDEFGKVVFDTRKYDIPHATDYLLPHQSKPFVQEKLMYEDYFFNVANVRESGNYTITFFQDEYKIRESFTVYFDFEKFMERLKKG